MQEAVLEDLLPFKNLSDEDQSEFYIRMRQTFDEIDYSVSAKIDVPDVPHRCEMVTIDALNVFISELEEELSFLSWLQIVLDDCCNDLLNDMTISGEDEHGHSLIEKA